MVTINVDEGAAYGAAILAAVGGGLYGTVEEACDAIIHETSRETHNETTAKVYDAWFAEYRAAYQALAPGFRRAAKLL